MFAAPTPVSRLRAQTSEDRYSKKQRPDWSLPLASEDAIPDAWIGESSTSRAVDASRAQVLEFRSLFLPASFPLALSDRVRDDSTGVVYEIEALPPAVSNPFTGWAPPREVPLIVAEG